MTIDFACHRGRRMLLPTANNVSVPMLSGATSWPRFDWCAGVLAAVVVAVLAASGCSFDANELKAWPHNDSSVAIDGPSQGSDGQSRGLDSGRDLGIKDLGDSVSGPVIDGRASDAPPFAPDSQTNTPDSAPLAKDLGADSRLPTDPMAGTDASQSPDDVNTDLPAEKTAGPEPPRDGSVPDGPSGPCSNPTLITMGSTPQGYFTLYTTGPICLFTCDTVVGWNCSNSDGRTFVVNGAAVSSCEGASQPALTKRDGYNVFQIGAGSKSYASISWWGSGASICAEPPGGF